MSEASPTDWCDDQFTKNNSKRVALGRFVRQFCGFQGSWSGWVSIIRCNFVIDVNGGHGNAADIERCPVHCHIDHDQTQAEQLKMIKLKFNFKKFRGRLRLTSRCLILSKFSIYLEDNWWYIAVSIAYICRAKALSSSWQYDRKFQIPSAGNSTFTSVCVSLRTCWCRGKEIGWSDYANEL